MALTLSREAGAAALVTIILVKGSAPRHEGSSMLLLASGEILGTVGGAEGELRAIEAARRAIESRRSSLIEARMLGLEAEGSEPICGGSALMLVEFVADGRPYAAAAAALAVGRRAVLEKRLDLRAGGSVDLSAGPAGSLDVAVTAWLEGDDMPPRAAEAAKSGKVRYFEAESLFLDPLPAEEKLLVVGAGHVGLSLARSALPLGFAVTVIDDRPELLATERLGPGIRAIAGPYAEAIGAFPFDASTYAAVMTHGHLHDLEACRALMRKPFRYAGVIGSARKAAALLGRLRADGFEESRVAALHSPIGLAIGAETPAEIAVAILAEMIAARRGLKPAAPLAPHFIVRL